MAFHAYPALLRAKTDSALALEQLYDYASSPSVTLPVADIEARRVRLASRHSSRATDLAALEIAAGPGERVMTAPLIVSTFRRIVRDRNLRFRTMNESISNYAHVWNHLEPRAGEVMTSGASSLGWALGAAIGSAMAGDVAPDVAVDLTSVFVGDGSFIFGVPSASYWMSRRYDKPFLTVIFNNGVRLLLSLWNPSLSSELLIRKGVVSLSHTHRDGRARNCQCWACTRTGSARGLPRATSTFRSGRPTTSIPITERSRTPLAVRGHEKSRTRPTWSRRCARRSGSSWTKRGAPCSIVGSNGSERDSGSSSHRAPLVPSLRECHTRQTRALCVCQKKHRERQSKSVGTHFRCGEQCYDEGLERDREREGK